MNRGQIDVRGLTSGGMFELSKQDRETGKDGVAEARRALQRTRLGFVPDPEPEPTESDGVDLVEDRWAERADLR